MRLTKDHPKNNPEKEEIEIQVINKSTNEQDDSS